MESYTVLLVDDERELINSLKRALQDEPYNTLYATSAQEALAFMAEEDIQILVSDVRMPGMSGLELMQEVKASYPDVIRILLSGHPSLDPDDISSLVRAVHQGDIFKFVAKSVELDECVKEVIRDAIEHWKKQMITTSDSQ